MPKALEKYIENFANQTLLYKRDPRKLLFGVSDEVRHKQGCTVTDGNFGFRK